ncbi:AsnC family transcriptional regulator [candidate division MSBL1 archaeon SCGC-AAA382A03]|uniref:AsnC family transcriptional regulator n=1 Tax=candidate division MSBL1 archaeon SCGC-AAA382A03 TaxID=1698278 RepID=A0A133VC66_9EURY|nr:AsnC family transcriptional regulator [candidate division MSBL1 archaeon SCGC-AAA382A03]
MTEAFVLTTTEVGKVRDVFNKTKDLKGIKDVRIVTGPYDLIIQASAEDMAELTNVIIEKIHEIEGVIDTNTAIIVE